MLANTAEIGKRLCDAADISGTISNAMTTIETEDKDLRGVLPKNQTHLDKSSLVSGEVAVENLEVSLGH